MACVFLIFGYGTPQDIFKDKNYHVYLSIVFNMIFDIAQKRKIDPYIIFCGGNTDFFEPYKRTEAQEMKKYFESLFNRPFLRNYPSTCHLFIENKSLSTLENMLFAAEIIKNKIQNPERIFIFCEKTRERRVKIVSRDVFHEPLKVLAVDFDTSEDRYLDTSFIRKKENLEMKNSLWALKSSKNQRKHHEIFQEKFDLLRRTLPKDRPNVLRKFRDEFANMQK